MAFRLIVVSVRFSNIFRCQNISILYFSDLNGSKLTFFLALIFVLSSIFDPLNYFCLYSIHNRVSFVMHNASLVVTAHDACICVGYDIFNYKSQEIFTVA